MSRFVCVLPIFALAFLAGCDSEAKLYSVEGSVVFNDRPPEGALVIFFPEGNDTMNATVPSAIVGKDGTFQLNTNGKPGAPAGKYKVVVKIPLVDPRTAKGEAFGAMGTGEEKTEAKHVGGPFAEKATTTLSAEVKRSDNKLDPIRLP